MFVRALRAGGARVALAASNPLSTQDDIAAALAARDGVEVFARAGVDRETYYQHIGARRSTRTGEVDPDLVIDDGGDLVSTLHTDGAAGCSVHGCAAAARGRRPACSGCAGWRPTRRSPFR